MRPCTAARHGEGREPQAELRRARRGVGEDAGQSVLLRRVARCSPWLRAVQWCEAWAQESREVREDKVLGVREPGWLAVIGLEVCLNEAPGALVLHGLPVAPSGGLQVVEVLQDRLRERHAARVTIAVLRDPELHIVIGSEAAERRPLARVLRLPPGLQAVVGVHIQTPDVARGLPPPELLPGLGRHVGPVLVARGDKDVAQAAAVQLVPQPREHPRLQVRRDAAALLVMRETPPVGRGLVERRHGPHGDAPTAAGVRRDLCEIRRKFVWPRERAAEG
mmetsp:Transcript_35296/g.112291  ORF Transcript_35296/g.112291 Transcript_35296/m.112291 type:complete len:278 (+) Transcript_35296:1005-1838(+)